MLFAGYCLPVINKQFETPIIFSNNVMQFSNSAGSYLRFNSFLEIYYTENERRRKVMWETGFLYSSVPPWYLDPVSNRLAAQYHVGHTVQISYDAIRLIVLILYTKKFDCNMAVRRLQLTKCISSIKFS
jgi:hypothetical protein